MNLSLLQNITAIVFLVIFFLGRYSWSVLKGKRVHSKTKKTVREGRIWISILVYVILPLLCVTGLFSTFEILTQNLPLYVFGTFFASLGLLFMFWTRFHRNRDWGLMGDDSGENFFTTGPYAITRHPYYIGSMMLGVGIYFILNSWFALSMIIVWLFVRKVIKDEEVFLKERFGNAWEEYKKKTPIIPWLY